MALDGNCWIMELDSKLSDRKTMSTGDVMNFIELCMETYLQFDGTMYK